MFICCSALQWQMVTASASARPTSRAPAVPAQLPRRMNGALGLSKKMCMKCKCCLLIDFGRGRRGLLLGVRVTTRSGGSADVDASRRWGVRRRPGATWGVPYRYRHRTGFSPWRSAAVDSASSCSPGCCSGSVHHAERPVSSYRAYACNYCHNAVDCVGAPRAHIIRNQTSRYPGPPMSISAAASDTSLCTSRTSMCGAMGCCGRSVWLAMSR